MHTPLQASSAEPFPKEAVLVDPEAYDASEQKFAASLADPNSGWVMEEELNESEEPVNFPDRTGQDAENTPAAASNPAHSASDAPRAANPEAWRQEVAKRLNNYRARRGSQQPRYPSLQLKFPSNEPPERTHSASPEAQTHLIVEGSAAAAQVAHERSSLTEPVVKARASNPLPESTARVIPFPRSATAPPRPLDELAEPLQLFPRILDVPEVAPPPPALGGILIEPPPEEPFLKRPGIEIPLQTSSFSRRFLAAAIDLILVVFALGLFGYVCIQINATIPPLKPLIGMAALVLGILWCGYQYLLLTYTGSTPGLKLARLRLSKFDGSSVSRRGRRWRVLASILSGLSLGLGYAWCMLDEDQLCWHDRITRTHLAPR